jgi:hypothetical protein
MAISQYWVGQIPLRNLTINVKDSNGRPLNCSAYTDVSVRMLGSHNEEIDLAGAVLNTAGAVSGRFIFEWPRDKSLFKNTGDYVLQVILKTGNAVDITTAHVMRVKELGGIN